MIRSASSYRKPSLSSWQRWSSKSAPQPKPIVPSSSMSTMHRRSPGSVFEFIDIIPRLTDPAQFGGDPKDAFTVIAPSLPGYGLSFKPGQKRFTLQDIADCLHDLMTKIRLHSSWPISPVQPITVPTGYAAFPKEIIVPPRSIAEKTYTNIQRWTEMKKGGHFAAMEQPGPNNNWQAAGQPAPIGYG